MRRNVRMGVLAVVGVATLAAAVAIHQSRAPGRRSGLRGVKDLWEVALDGAVGQPRRLLAANLPRLRLRFARRPTRGVA